MFFKYLKFIGIFTAIELFFIIIISLCNLIFLNTSIAKILLLFLNLLLFYIYGYINGKVTCKKGLVEGLITGSILSAILFFLSLIFFIKDLKIISFLYYIILIIMSMVGATISKNKKEAKKSD